MVIINKNTYRVAIKNSQKINKQLQKKLQVTLPSGKIYINDPILLNKNGCWLKGCGASTQLILINDRITDMIIITSDRCKVSDLMIIGNRPLDTQLDEFKNNTQGCGILIEGSFRTMIQNVYIHNTMLDGIYSVGNNDKMTSLTHIDNCTIERAGRNSIHNGNYSQDLIVTNTFTQDAEQHGILLNNNYGSVITNSHFYRNKSHNVYIDGGARHRFENCTIDKSYYWGVFLNNTNDILLSKCIIFDNNQSDTDCGGIKLADKVYKCIIMQNTIYNDPPVTQTYGIYIDNSCVNNNIIFNEVRNSIKKNYFYEDNNTNIVIFSDDGIIVNENMKII